jgi:para-nitrobenzyl esterase
MESGACAAAARSQREGEGKVVAEKAGCAPAASIPGCLRGLDTEAIVRAVPGEASVVASGLNNYGPVVDGYVIPAPPHDLLVQGRHNRMPFIVGNNSDETSRSVPRVQTCAAYEAAVRGYYPLIAPRVLEVYPCAGYDSPHAALTAVTSDPRFVCTARLAARSAAKGQEEAVYRFQYSHAIESPLLRDFGAFHGAEIPFVFQRLDIARYRPSTAEEALATNILLYWTRFAATGDPNGPGTPQWPRYDPARDTYLDLDTTIVAGEGLRQRECEFWERSTGATSP